MEKIYFKLFSNCIPVKGAKNHIICDLALNRYLTIPELIYNVFAKLKDKTIYQIKKHYNNQINKDIDRFFNFLVREDWGFYTNEKASFPALDLEYSTPLLFNNAIFDYSKKSTYNLFDAIEKVDNLGCRAIQIRFFYHPNIQFLLSLLKSTKNFSINYIEIILKGNRNSKWKHFVPLFRENTRLRKIAIYDQDSNKTIKIEENYTDYGSIYLINHILKDETSCGCIRKENFVSDITLFSESQKFNSCLNKKISVDQNGLIKNCPSMKHNFGKIEKSNILNISKKYEFRRLWELSKDKIKICQDCEFRYICVDCRAYLSDTNNIYSKPLKCSYNPYLGEWGTQLANC